MWRRGDPQGDEARKVKYDVVPYTRGVGLDLGCGKWKLYDHFIGVDSGKQWGGRVTDVMHSCEDLSLFATQSMDFVFSSHLLEHIEDYRAALKEWWRVIRPGGFLVLYLPHEDLYPRVGQDGANPDHKHNLSNATVIEALSDVVSGFELIVDEIRDADNGPGKPGNEYSFLQVYRKLVGRKQVTRVSPKPEKTAAVIRYGAFGDVLQAAGVFEQLKAQGYHVTLWTVPNGELIARNNPNIDEIVIQDKDQVPNHELGQFWDVISKKYDKFVNLSESVEGTFLAYPGRAPHRWPDEVRREKMGGNYLEFIHDLAGVDYIWPVRAFHPTEDEKAWARKQRAGMDARIVMLYVLAGSGVHKKWPHMDSLISRVMLEHPDVHIVTVGGELEKILEAGWEAEPRVHLRSGEWTIRQTLAFLDQVDVVFGPETGVLNGAAMMDIRKVVLLSHSSQENLTKHWVNTAALSPDSEHVPCYPCHMLHYGFEHCWEHKESGTAMCQFDISVDAVMEALHPVFGRPLESPLAAANM